MIQFWYSRLTENNYYSLKRALIGARVSWVHSLNYGPDLLDRKGIAAGVLLGQQYLYNWTVYPLPLEQLTHLPFQAQTSITGPAFYRASFEVSDQRDTFLALPGWTRGVCWVNGFNLGRYWRRGPQQTLYVPGSLLKAGENELILFELRVSRSARIGAGLAELRE